MAPSFLNLKELRRRSRVSLRASFKPDRAADDSSEASNTTTPTSGSSTPPSIGAQSDPALNLLLKEQLHQPHPGATLRPQPHPYSNAASNRYSVSGMVGLGSPVPGGRGPALPVSQYSPQVTNVADSSWVYQKVLLVQGTIGDASHQSLDGTLTVSRLDDSFPAISWPVHDSRFKALVYLMPGANRLRFDFASPKLANSGSSNPIHASYLTVHMIPPVGAPPLQLAILLGKDSPGTFDAVPARIEREGNGLEIAVRKFRMAAYLWQAFTAEQMWRNRLGRRAFRFEEEWTTGAANHRDRENGTLRSEARVHIIRTEKTVAELRDLDRAQQNPDATDKGALYGIAADAVRDYFKPLPGQKLYVSVLLLDAHWDTTSKAIVGHAALGGQVGDIHLGIFGSHCLQSYPASLEEVVPAFTDCTPTDTAHVANDCADAGSSWEAANIGIGAHLHETGHLFGLPHRESGVMLRDYVTLNRSFLTREAYSTRTRSKGGPVASQQDECAWHRLDCLRLRSHPCFRLPNDSPPHPDDSVQGWPMEPGGGGPSLAVTAASGIAYVEVYAEGDDDVCRAWVEYLPENGAPISRMVNLAEGDLRARLPEGSKRKGKLRISVKSYGGGSLDVDDFSKLCSREAACLKLPSAVPGLGKTALRGKTLGHGQMQGSEACEVVFASALHKERVLSRVVVYHGSAVDGLEFGYDDGSAQVFGKKGGKVGGDVFELDIRRGEYITGFFVRAGFWIDAIQVLTSLGRSSPVFGNPYGGDPHTLIPPRGYNICGVTGSCGAWLDGFSVIIAK
ncbi:putative peptidase family-domain-containing protein [Staphylotrichum tortipilum]|uniref:Peptidase family-domain-containing protein n=1 Tax=Staphylotrichum tortipilum TaxID=2831512 RepID=A0AAN6MFN4_9PEZI|nr:putative peptidase family-domain-containing protein [Staphylotrichum longicolle]